jgi:hypothetical protein
VHDWARSERRNRSTPPEGLRRVELVRLSGRRGAVVAHAVGVLHRYPRTVRISLATAARLIAAGTPVRDDRLRAQEV